MPLHFRLGIRLGCLLLGIALLMSGVLKAQDTPKSDSTGRKPGRVLERMKGKRPVPRPAPTLGQSVNDTSVQDTAPKKVEIINASFLTFQRRGDTAVQKLIGDVRLKQDSTFFYCDSAYLYEEENTLAAFGNVRIEMPDSVFLYSNRLVYTGDTRIAEVYEDITLTDQQSTLTTDRLTYHRNEEYGYYQEGGTLKDGESVLTSARGYYYPNRDEAFFQSEVTLTHPDYTLNTDTLVYDTERKIARFVTRTEINSKDGVIETTRGSYDTEASKIDLFERSQVQDSSYTLTADTLYYTDGANLGIAMGDVVVVQEDSTLEIRGDVGRFNRATDESMLTGNAVAIQRMDEDTLYIFADTLFSRKDTQYIDLEKAEMSVTDTSTTDTLSTQDSLLSATDSLVIDSVAGQTDSLVIQPDSSRLEDTLGVADTARAFPQRGRRLFGKRDSGLVVAPDTLKNDSSTVIDLGPPTLTAFEGRIDTVVTRIFQAHYNVRFFMSDMQGRADSMRYLYDDSTLFLHKDPVLWSDENQLSGTRIGVWMKNESADSMHVAGEGFMASEVDTVGYNQLKGKEMRIKFRENSLYRLQVVGNSESIYYVENETDSTGDGGGYQGMNKALSNEMTLYFAESELERIVFQSKPEGTFYPFYQIVFENNTLDGLNWRGDERPEKPLWLLPPAPPKAIDSSAVPTIDLTPQILPDTVQIDSLSSPTPKVPAVDGPPGRIRKFRQGGKRKGKARQRKEETEGIREEDGEL